MRTMYDGVTPSRLPAGAPLYAGYVDGDYANLPKLRARFPHARIVEIAVSPHTNAGHVLDVERGDATPAQAPGWVRMRRAAGADPTIYCAASALAAVKAAFASAGIAQPHFWVADWDGHAELPAGTVAKQFLNTAGYDKSCVADHWPGVDPAPKPTPAPAYEPFPGAAWFKVGRRSPIVAAMHARLVAVGCNKYRSSTNRDVIGSGDIASYEAWQRKCGYSGAAATWPPGKTSWDRLKVPNS